MRQERPDANRDEHVGDEYPVRWVGDEGIRGDEPQADAQRIYAGIGERVW